MPHLEISNAVMTALAERDAPGEVDTKLAGSIFPPPLPFSADHVRLGLSLEKLGTDLSELYRLYSHTVDGHEAARLRLGLSEPEYDLFVTRRETDDAITDLWGIRDDEEKRALLDGDLGLVRKKLGLSVKELKGPQTPKRIADKWGKVHNRIQQEQRVDAALQDERGRPPDRRRLHLSR